MKEHYFLIGSALFVLVLGKFVYFICVKVFLYG